MNENVIEWISGQEKATVTLFRGRLRTKVLKLYDKEEVEILRYPEENNGYLLARIPVKWIKISPPKKMSEERRHELSEVMKRRRNDSK